MREFKKPDVKAPRFRPQVYSVLNSDFLGSFKKKFSKYKHIDDTVLKKIGKTFNTHVYQTVIDVRDGVQLPESIGWLFIGTCEQSKKENIDFAKSTKYGVIVTNRNWETDGKLAKIFFTSYALKHKMKNREFWEFVACRDFKRLVAKTYPENWNMYVAVDPAKRAKLAYQKTVLKNMYKAKESEDLKNYNEFDL
jgi:hypothetical protein